MSAALEVHVKYHDNSNVLTYILKLEIKLTHILIVYYIKKKVPTTQLAKMSIDPKFLEIFL